ncbi:MAG: hypothetical protein IPK89_00775 [Sphingomonadales bacterium]|nr:hypothetical protein [Sphingomonadales bacterium]
MTIEATEATAAPGRHCDGRIVALCLRVGKTTLLRIIAGLAFADDGTVLFGGRTDRSSEPMDLSELCTFPTHDGRIEHWLRPECHETTRTARQGCDC